MLTKVLAGLTIAGSLCVAGAATWYGVNALRPETPAPTQTSETPPCCASEKSCCDEPAPSCCPASQEATKSCCDE